MSQGFRKHILFYFVLILLFFNSALFLAGWQNSHRKFIFAMLDVGQGDALFIQSPSGTQILVDSGPPRKILGELARVMPAFDRKIDAILITNPDEDHLGGFSDVLKNYKVGVVFEPGTISDSKIYKNLKTEIGNKKIPDVLLRKGMNLDLGSGVMINILFPDRDVSTWDTNYGSVVARLVYGDTSIMLTGDIPAEMEKIILSENSSVELQSDILKVAHHGSKNSSSFEFIETVSPEYAFISVGKNNKYGHPNQQVLDIFSKIGTKILRADQLGTIILKCVKINECKINK